MLVKLAFVMQRLKKYLKKFFVMIDKDGTIFGFYEGDTAVMRGDIELMGGPPSPPPPPPTRENPATGGDCIFKTCEIPMESIKQVKMAFFS